ncbi:MAG: response regulator [Exilispira sp.]|jgi:two-component system chemotaxis response regulator CheY|nr:response regulator [Exilispira sp.]
MVSNFDFEDEIPSIPDINKKNPDGLKPDGTPINVLIADDSMFVQKLLQQILLSEQYNVIDVASDGEEALAKFQQHINKIDLVTLDITMPKMDGLTVLENILKIKPDTNIIMISALGREDLVKKALTIGAKNYIVKPLNREKVLSRIKQTMDRIYKK